MMRPGQITPNELEIAILKRMAVDVPALNMFIGQLHVLSRKYTGVGSYTDFRIDAESGDLPAGYLGLHALICVPNVPSGMGAVLSTENGQPEFLEIFTYGEELWDGLFAGFTIDSDE